MSLLCSIGLTPSPARDVAEVRGVQQHRLLASLVDGPSRTDTPLVGRFDPPRGVDPVALLESHLASGWPYDVVTVIDAPIDEVSRSLPTHLGRLEALEDGTTRLVGSTSIPEMYAQGLSLCPAPFRVQDGDEVRAAVLALGQRLLAAGSGIPSPREAAAH